jgi:hypothetical protein
LGILEEVEDIIANDNAGFPGQDVFGTHVDLISVLDMVL